MMKIISRTRFTTILTRLGKNVQSHFMMGMGYVVLGRFQNSSVPVLNLSINSVPVLIGSS